jgi:hypothetical protein
MQEGALEICEISKPINKSGADDIVMRCIDYYCKAVDGVPHDIIRTRFRLRGCCKFSLLYVQFAGVQGRGDWTSKGRM